MPLPHSFPGRPAASRGFTLIELLTVIAIIGILAAIIIPVTGKVRDTARKATCTANLRHVHNWLMLYANDHKGRFPAPFGPNLDTPGSTAATTWWAVLQIANQRVYTTPAVGESNQALNPFFCPSAGEGFPNGVRRVYPINADGGTASLHFSPERNTKWSQTLLVADGTSNGGDVDSWAYFRASDTTPGIALDPRHNRKINGLFLDGHIASFDLTEPQLETWIKNLRRN